MEYLYAFLLFIGIVFLTTLLTAILKILIPIAYLALGYYLGIESIIMGIGASLGAVVNIGNVSHYMKTEGAMSSAPYYSKLGSYGLIIAFIVGLFFKDSSYVDSSSGNGWLIFLGISIAIILSPPISSGLSPCYPQVTPISISMILNANGLLPLIAQLV